MSDLILERERWAEAEAARCDMAADTLEQSAGKWVAGGVNSYSAEGAYRASIAAEVWRTVARSLRGPAIARREYEPAPVGVSPTSGGGDE